VRDTGEVRFLGADDAAHHAGALAHSGFIVARVTGLGPSFRGRLADAIDAAIELALAERAAAGPGIAQPGDSSAALSDQLYRARRAGACGLALFVGPLARITGPLGTIDPVDSEHLRFLADAARERSVVLMLDASDAGTAAYGAPIQLAQLLSSAPARATETASLEKPATPAVEPRGIAAHLAGVSVVEHEQAWRAWTLQLAAIRGPLPLGALERAFAESYVPLGHAIATGLDDPRARAAHEDFRSTFVKSYTETSATFAATTKRPRMVFDAHDIAARLGRLHGARSVRLLLVDSMRWDLARRIAEHASAGLGSRAVMTDEVMLWAALPTTTMRQLETIARGVEALRAPAELDPEVEPMRGRTADYVRRLRIGPREIHKLDLVEARLQGVRTGGVLRALPDIAAACGEVVVRHARGLAPRTLLFVFGDHGFVVDRNGNAGQGGASPDEVLVGAFALLVGDVH
jgi:hypothetical protein